MKSLFLNELFFPLFSTTRTVASVIEKTLDHCWNRRFEIVRRNFAIYNKLQSVIVNVSEIETKFIFGSFLRNNRLFLQCFLLMCCAGLYL
jgi:hypothetical protein